MNIFAARRLVWAATIPLASAAACAVLALFVVRGTLASDVGTTIAAAFAYMLPLMALQAVTEKALQRRADSSRFSVDWIVYGGKKLALGLVAAGIGSSLLLLLGLVRNWQDLYLANRMVVVVSVIVSCLFFGCTIRPRAALRSATADSRSKLKPRDAPCGFMSKTSSWLAKFKRR